MVDLLPWWSVSEVAGAYYLDHTEVSHSEKVTKLHAICNETGRMANFSFRKSKENQQVLIGEKNKYEALSREAFNNKMKKRKNY